MNPLIDNEFSLLIFNWFFPLVFSPEKTIFWGKYHTQYVSTILGGSYVDDFPSMVAVSLQSGKCPINTINATKYVHLHKN